MSDTVSSPPFTSYIGNAIGIAKTLDSYGLDGAALAGVRTMTETHVVGGGMADVEPLVRQAPK